MPVPPPTRDEARRATVLFNLGVSHERGVGVARHEANALRFYQQAAARGHADAQCRLGVCFATGELCVARDWAEAARYYALAAAQGLDVAQCNLGLCFQLGKGVAQDWAEAVRYYRLAAEQGLALAQCNLGRCFERGTGVAQDSAEAVRYYRLATAQPEGAMSSEQRALVLAACDALARSRDVAAACCLGCGLRRAAQAQEVLQVPGRTVLRRRVRRARVA